MDRGGAEGLELLHEHVGEIRFLGEFAAGGGFDVFVLVNEAAGEGSLVFEGFYSATDQKNFQSAAIESEDHAIDRESRVGELVAAPPDFSSTLR